MLARLASNGVEKARILHIAQSIYHDHIPAKKLGLKTCWIDRRHGAKGWGATMPPNENVAPDFHFHSLLELALAWEQL